MSLKDLFIRRERARFAAGGIDRRQFITSLVAAGVVLPTAMTMASEVMAQTPKKGGTYRMGIAHGSTTDNVDPATYENGFSVNYGWAWGNCLMTANSKGELVGDLAESVESSDGKVWTAKLKKGVTFHNGKSLDADDVIASIQHHLGEDSKSAAKGVIGGVESMKKEDANTVVFTLKTPDADFPYILSDYHLLIMPAADGKVDATSAIGTGPYKSDRYEPGVRAEMSRFDGYHDSDAAHFDEVLMLSIIDATARQQALLSGDVDAIDNVDPKTVDLLARAPIINILETTGTQHYTFPMRVTSDPFTNLDLRNALKLAVNRKELVDKILLGHGTVGNDHPIGANQPFHADLPQREFDPEKAAELYKKSGHSGTIQLSASNAAFAGAVDAAELIAASAKQAGIDVQVVREAEDGYWSNVWNKKGWCACYWSGRPTVDWMYRSGYVDDIEWNDTDWRTQDGADEFNKLVREARGEVDQTKRAELYRQTQEILRDKGGALVPMFANYIHGLSKKVSTGESVSASSEFDGNKSTQRWWFS